MLLQPIPLGYCQCGCGNLATIAKAANKRLRVRKGQPNRFILGHHANVTAHCQTLRPTGPVASLPLFGGGRAIAYTSIDADDWDAVTRYRWRLSRYGYARTTDPRTNVDILLHRLLMGFARGDPRQVDHINRDRIDNRRQNLRPASVMEQAQNRKAIGGSSEHRGVCLDRKSGKWQATVRVDGTLHYLGQYHDELEAAQVASDFRAVHMPFSEDARRAA